MRNILLAFFFSVIFMLSALAQDPATETFIFYEDDTVSASPFDTIDVAGAIQQFEWDHLDIEADERIRMLLEIQKEESIRKRGFEGFRVQLYQGSNKDEAYKMAADFMQKYPDYKVYIPFRTPDFRVRVGDFRTRSEAIWFKYNIEKDFPNPFIVEDIINFPDLVFEEGNK